MNLFDKSLIFDISPGKTGTTSLATAMGILGYDACHGCPGPFQENFLKGVLSDNLDLDIFGAYDFIGNLVNFMYPRLERRFPNAKFILLERDEGDWLNSTIYQLNKNRFPVSKELTVGTLLRIMNIGCIHTDDPYYLKERYRAHMQAVEEYFSDSSRQHKLLRMKITDGWGPLCRFLWVTPPSTPFPKQNVSR